MGFERNRGGASARPLRGGFSTWETLSQRTCGEPGNEGYCAGTTYGVGSAVCQDIVPWVMSRYHDFMTGDVEEFLQEIGATLREARVGALLTQSEIGQRAGVSRQLVSRIEQGCNGEISAYVAVATALGHRFTVVRDAALDDGELAGLDFSASSSPLIGD